MLILFMIQKPPLRHLAIEDADGSSRESIMQRGFATLSQAVCTNVLVYVAVIYTPSH